MIIGAMYSVRPAFALTQEGAKPVMRGTCVAVHPKGRFAVLEFEGVWGTVRECFWPEQVTDRNRVTRKGKKYGK